MNGEKIIVRICADGIMAEQFLPSDDAIDLVSVVGAIKIKEAIANWRAGLTILRTFEIESIRYVDTTDQCGQCNIIDIPVGGQIVCNPIGIYEAEVLPNGKIKIL